MILCALRYILLVLNNGNFGGFCMEATVSRLDKLKKQQEQLDLKKKQLRAEIEKIKAAKQLAERKQDMQRKVLVGTYYLEQAAKDEKLMQKIKNDMAQFLTRESDLALFGLPEVIVEK